MSLYDYTVKGEKGNDVPLSEYEGKVLLIINTATRCGFTPQYEGLQKLYDQYRSHGFEILDFPCNQFANQTPGTAEEIHEFCETRYGVTFPQFAKIEVNGPGEAPLYTYLKKRQGGLVDARIKWNFTKFLVNRQGEVVKRYAPTKTPEAIEKEIMALLGIK